jgi:hypothetical protein
MLSFLEYMTEHVLSIGINPKHEKYREQYRSDIHDVLRNSYEPIGGYGGISSGSEDESKAIHNDISNSLMKLVTRKGKVSAVTLYKPQHGRKAIAVGTDNSRQGKMDFKKTAVEDNELKRAWLEGSGSVEAIQRKIGSPVVSSSEAEGLLGKKVRIVDKERYKRKIGKHSHEKVIMGYPKKES